METAIIQNNHEAVLYNRQRLDQVSSTDKPFMQANTDECSYEEIRNNHIIPVYLKDNEPLISQTDFIDATTNIVNDLFEGEVILKPSIRVSHAIKGRIPEAKHKPAIQLMEHEKTLYYERMAFIIELPTISDSIDGNILSLTIGGVKSFSLDNMYGKKGTDEHFKVFIGFQNKVCTNLCVWTDGYMNDLKVNSIGQLKASIRTLIEKYNHNFHLFHLRKLTEYSITEQQFANVIGRARMYNHLPNDVKSGINPLLLSDTQINAVVKDYYRDSSFCRDGQGDINLWKLYNLLTGSNKTSYIDTFLDRSVNAYSFVEHLKYGLETPGSIWYLN